MTNPNHRRRCATCGQSLPPSRNARYCSGRCRELWKELQELEDCVNEFVEATDRVKAALNAAGIESGGDGPRPAR